MAKATYWQRGETLDYINETNLVIEENTVINLFGRIGVAGTSINPGAQGSVHVTGVYEIAKTGTDAIAQGADVYWDGNGITGSAKDNQVVGYAAQAAGASDTTILVKLMG